MSLLLISLMVFALVAAAGLFAYGQVLQGRGTDDWAAPAAAIDYRALHAHWRGHAPVRDWEGLKAQVRGWQADAAPEECEAVARNLNAAVFRFALPGEPLQLGRPADPPHAAAPAWCPARRRARARRRT